MLLKQIITQGKRALLKIKPKLRVERVRHGDGSWDDYIYDYRWLFVRHENSKGYWENRSYDSQGNFVRFENSEGVIEEYKP